MPDPNPQENKPEEIVEYNKDSAVLKKDLMVGLIRTEQGPAILVNLRGREEIILAKGEVEAFLTMKLLQGDIRAEQMRNKIVPAKHGIMDFVKNRIK